jgi:hypothetical protein
MVTALQNPDRNRHRNGESSQGHPENEDNRVLHILMRRLGHSQTFGENLIFMLNRAGMSTSQAFALPLFALLG